MNSEDRLVPDHSEWERGFAAAYEKMLPELTAAMRKIGELEWIIGRYERAETEKMRKQMYETLAESRRQHEAKGEE